MFYFVMETPLIIGIVIVLIALFILMWWINLRNTFAKMLIDIDNSESRIDVYLTKRYDLLTKMISSTKGYAKHESETLTGIIKMRNPGATATMKEKADFDLAMTAAAKQINVVAEQYPTLKADALFLKLQSSIEEVEENLQAARSNYNSNVAIYNKKIVIFPNNLVAGKKFTRREFFEADEAKREDVKIEF